MADIEFTEAILNGLPLAELDAPPDAPPAGKTIIYRYSGMLWAIDENENIISLEPEAPPPSDYARLEDQKSQHSDGGTFTSGAWRTRILNTEVIDTGGIVSLSSNQFTLQAGMYYIMVFAPVFGVQLHNARLQNITDTETTLWGTPGRAAADITDASRIQGEFTIAGQKTFEIQHRCSSTNNSIGFGIGAGFADVERFTIVEIWKL